MEEGTIPGPRILFSGTALSQTGGHGDMRLRGEDEVPACCCPLSLGRVCDGVAQVRQAARDELRKGAHQIKIMASGGVSSPTDKLTNLQVWWTCIRAILSIGSIPVLILLVLSEGGVLLPSKQVCVTPGCSEGLFSTLVYKYECAIYICTIYLRKKFQKHNYVVHFSVRGIL